MTAIIPIFDKNDNPAEIGEALRKDGCAIVRNALSLEAVDELKALLKPEFDKMTTDPSSLVGNKKTIGNMFSSGREFSDHLLLNPVLLNACDSVLLPQEPMGPAMEGQSMLRKPTTSDDFARIYEDQWKPRDPIKGPNCHHYRLSISMAVQVWEGKSDQPLHREMDIYRPFIEQSAEQPECVLTANFAASDFTAENGGTQLVPGSHLWPKEREPEEHEIARTVMPKGSVVFWTGRMFHAFGVNVNNEVREGFLFSMTANWLATEENQYLAVPPKLAHEHSYRAQQLLGYRASLLVGWLDGRNSENLLEAGGSGPLELGN